MGGCSVVGCRNRFARGKLHFYRFPRDARREVWIQFTRKGANFQPKGSSTICQVHFDSQCFLEKKDRVHLTKDAVPTIFFRQSFLGMEMVQVPFDSSSNQYSNLDLFQNTAVTEDEEAVTLKRDLRVDELKLLCRFCFCYDPNHENSCVSISKLDDYKINLDDLLVSLGLPPQTNDFFGDLICEQCFQQIVDIDLFKKKCREAQEEVAAEITELNNKIEEIRKTKPKRQEVTQMEILEEHLVEDDDFDETNFQYDPQPGDQDLNEEYIEEIHDGFKIVYQMPESTVIDEKLVKEMTAEDTSAIDIEFMLDGAEETEDKTVPHGVDEYQIVTTDDIIKNPERNRFCFRIYECFFCKMKFAGRKTYIAHKCSVESVKCEQCDKMFSKIQAYNSHVSHVHGSLPISKHFCPICKTVIMSTLNQFKQHRRQCNRETKNQPIECEICSKMCNNLKGYTIHKLFHDTRNFTTSTGEKIVTDGLNAYKGHAICELCGKDFQSNVGYRMHKRNVHRIGQAEGETFHCHICSKICPTKRSLFDHMRNTHRIQESQCNICNKVFRTRVLLKKHMMYHDETKRTYMCKLCPDKPGYFTNVALKRHQKSHIGSRDYECDFEGCEAAYTTNHQLKVHKTNKHGVTSESMMTNDVEVS